MRRFGFLVSAQIVFAACVYAQCPVDFDWASVRRFYLTVRISSCLAMTMVTAYAFNIAKLDTLLY